MTIVQAALEEMCAHALDAAPGECCGVVIGTQGAIVATIRCRNVAREPTRYEIDPADHFAAIREARAKHLDVVGFYHSHPHSAAWPSPSDVAEAAYPDAVYLIVGTSRSGREVRAFSILEGRAEQIPLFSV